jgi:hypothetical protein
MPPGQALTAPTLLRSKSQQLLNGQQGRAAVHQPGDALMQLSSGLRRQLAVAVGINLDSQMKTTAVNCRD